MITKSDDGLRAEAGAAPLTKEERDAEDWAAEALQARLPHLRTTAQHWQSTISTITGLFGAATVINADAQIRALAAGYNYLYGSLVLLSLICAGLALAWASQAGEQTNLTIPPGIPERKTLHNNVFNKASKRLRCSRLIAVAAVVLLICALGVRWYAPHSTPAKSEDNQSLLGRAGAPGEG